MCFNSWFLLFWLIFLLVTTPYIIQTLSGPTTFLYIFLLLSSDLWSRIFLFLLLSSNLWSGIFSSFFFLLLLYPSLLIMHVCGICLMFSCFLILAVFYSTIFHSFGWCLLYQIFLCRLCFLEIDSFCKIELFVNPARG